MRGSKDKNGEYCYCLSLYSNYLYEKGSGRVCKPDFMEVVHVLHIFFSHTFPVFKVLFFPLFSFFYLRLAMASGSANMTLLSPAIWGSLVRWCCCCQSAHHLASPLYLIYIFRFSIHVIVVHFPFTLFVLCQPPV